MNNIQNNHKSSVIIQRPEVTEDGEHAMLYADLVNALMHVGSQPALDTKDLSSTDSTNCCEAAMKDAAEAEEQTVSLGNQGELAKKGENADKNANPLINMSSTKAVDDKIVSTDSEESFEVLPYLEDLTFANLPELIKPMAEHYSNGKKEKRGMIAVAELATLSSLIPNTETVINNKVFNAPLFMLIVGPSAAGKGNVEMCRLFFEGLDKKLYEKFQEERDAWVENEMRGASPSTACISIPANCSDAMFLQLMKDNHNEGIIFTTELKSLNKMLRADYGLSRDGLLAASMHENIDMARKGESRLFKLENPRLGLVCTGVMEDVSDFLGSDGLSSGLISRCLFYVIKPQRKVFERSAEDEIPAKEYLADIISKVEDLYLRLKQRPTPLRLKLTRSQVTRLEDWIAGLYENGEYSKCLGDSFDSVILRMNIHVRRICMVLSILRLYEQLGGIDDALSEWKAEDIDVQTALEICSVLFEHGKYVFIANMKESSKAKTSKTHDNIVALSKKMALTKHKTLLLALQSLGKPFDFKEFVEVAQKVGYANYSALNKKWHKMQKTDELRCSEGGMCVIRE